MGNKNKQLINSPVAVKAKLIKNLMSSASAAEIGELYIKAKHAVPMRTALAKLGHPRPPTPIQIDNSTANGIINSGTFRTQVSRNNNVN